jgi:hypothetical protein
MKQDRATHAAAVRAVEGSSASAGSIGGPPQDAWQGPFSPGRRSERADDASRDASIAAVARPACRRSSPCLESVGH